MFLAVEFDTYGSPWRELTKEGWDEIRSVVPSVSEEQSRYGPLGTHYINDDAIPVLARHAVSFKPSAELASQAIGSMLVKLQDRIEAVSMQKKSTAELAAAGCAVQVTIPDFALLLINEVTHLDNACTDSLQERLDEGWRILAVCPPNAQRRPDYILGRRKP